MHPLIILGAAAGALIWLFSDDEKPADETPAPRKKPRKSKKRAKTVDNPPAPASESEALETDTEEQESPTDEHDDPPTID